MGKTETIRHRLLATGSILLLGMLAWTSSCDEDSDAPAAVSVRNSFDQCIDDNKNAMFAEGRQIFRFDTFGNEEWWGDRLRLHQAILGAALGGVGPGVSPKAALAVGLKVDAEALPAALVEQLKAGQVDLDAPATTVALLRLNAVVGVTGFFDSASGALSRLGIQCALCHSTVDDSFSPGIGRRLDGWANRDLNVGAIINLSPDLGPLAEVLGVGEPTVRKVLAAWGPGKFDAELILDGKGFRPDGKTAATLLPPAFGLAGVNNHTWTGAWGTVTYWNAFVATLEMQGKGTFYDPRLDDAEQFPVAARNGFGNVRRTPDLITSKLAPLHLYQLAIPAPTPPPGSFDPALAAKGKTLFEGRATCARCHVPPLYTEPGWNLHTPEEIGIDSFQADRSPDRRYRTSPLKGLWTHTKGGFYPGGLGRPRLRAPGARAAQPSDLRGGRSRRLARRGAGAPGRLGGLPGREGLRRSVPLHVGGARVHPRDRPQSRVGRAAGRARRPLRVAAPVREGGARLAEGARSPPEGRGGPAPPGRNAGRAGLPGGGRSEIHPGAPPASRRSRGLVRPGTDAAPAEPSGAGRGGSERRIGARPRARPGLRGPGRRPAGAGSPGRGRPGLAHGGRPRPPAPSGPHAPHPGSRKGGEPLTGAGDKKSPNPGRRIPMDGDPSAGIRDFRVDDRT